jgi:hypothetical protein
MKIQQEFSRDPLSRYINPEEIEKTPAGFTDKMMMQVMIEAGRAESLSSHKKRSIVPSLAAILTSGLILVALLFPGNEPSHPVFTWLKYFDNFKITMPEIQHLAVFNITIPGIMLYVTSGLLLLLVLDRALSRYFH